MDAGEVIDVAERVIVSPVGGIYEPLVRSSDVVSGDVIGHIAVPGEDPVPVRSPFEGRLIEMVAWKGERLLRGQRVAWLRVA
jgi:predicted deacylase